MCYSQYIEKGIYTFSWVISRRCSKKELENKRKKLWKPESESLKEFMKNWKDRTSDDQNIPVIQLLIQPSQSSL
jgi:hypothetical protein